MRVISKLFEGSLTTPVHALKNKGFTYISLHSFLSMHACVLIVVFSTPTGGHVWVESVCLTSVLGAEEYAISEYSEIMITEFIDRTSFDHESSAAVSSLTGVSL